MNHEVIAVQRIINDTEATVIKTERKNEGINPDIETPFR
jgi:hypothetical protein